MTVPTVIRRYLKALEAGDLQGVLDCFSLDGVVVSPVYGIVKAQDFYARLFADTIRTEIVVRDLYAAQGRPDRAIAHFDYVWERRGEPTLETRLIDLFDFDPSGTKVVRLRIIMDTGVE